MRIPRITPAVARKLGHYVYLYVNPIAAATPNWLDRFLGRLRRLDEPTSDLSKSAEINRKVSLTEVSRNKSDTPVVRAPELFRSITCLR